MPNLSSIHLLLKIGGYNFANVYEFFLAIALRFPWATLTLSLAAILVGFALYVGIPNPHSDKAADKQSETDDKHEAKTDDKHEVKADDKHDDKADDSPLLPGIQTGLMPAMDEGAFVLDYFAPTGTPLERTEEMVRAIEHILLENPDVEVYVRRTGTQLGMFATRTNTGGIQVVLRPAENDPLSLLRKPVRPPFGKIEKQMME